MSHKVNVDCSLVVGLVLVFVACALQLAAVLTKGWLVHESDGLGLFDTCMNLQCNASIPESLDDEWFALRVVELFGQAACAVTLIMAGIHVCLVARINSLYRWLNTALGVACWVSGGFLLSGGVLLLVTESRHYYHQSDPALKPGYSFAISVSAAILILLAIVALQYEEVQDKRRTNSVKYSRRRRTLQLTSSDA